MSELVTDYMERTVARRVRLDMWWHLARCPACRRYFDQVRRTVMLLGSGSRTEPTQSTEDDLLAAARSEHQRNMR